MTETLDPMTDEVDQKMLAEQLLAQAKEQGTGSTVYLTVPCGRRLAAAAVCIGCGWR